MQPATVAILYDKYFSQVFRAAGQRAGSENDYKKFVRAFYKGNWVADGWIEQTEDAVRKGGPDLRPLMNTLGQRICGEWAKPNEMRTVTTNHLKQWGREAPDRPTVATIRAQIEKVEAMLPQPLIPVFEFTTLSL